MKAKQQTNEQNALRSKMKVNQAIADQEQSASRIATNPELVSGNMHAEYYALGGVMGKQTRDEVPGKLMLTNKMYSDMEKARRESYASGGTIHIKPENKGKFNATKALTGKSTEELTHSSNPVTKKRAIFAQNASHWNHKANGGNIADEPIEDGTATAMSSTTAQINGPSHADGGVQLPASDAEVEGGETTSGNFVFSDKLGYAQLHKPIAKAMGKIEQKPQTQERTNSLKRLQTQEKALATHQELYKKMHGLQ